MTAGPGAGPAADAAGSPALRSALIILGVALAVLLPEFVTGPSTSDSLRYNIVWIDQWRERFAAGDLYPRWLPRSWDGMGSPTFYFYPPLAFWCAAILDRLTLGALQTGTLLSLTSALLLAGSGLSMRAWLRAHVAPRAATVGALAYMLAPYHLYDIFARAALAETCAYTVLPTLMLGIRRTAQGRAAAVPLLALSYAALVLAHLPTALLATVLLVPAYGIFCLAGKDRVPRRLAGLAAGGLLGLGLGAFYLVPALGLTSFILAEAFSGPFYRPENWFFWRPDLWARYPVMWVVMAGWTAAALLTAASVLVARKRASVPEALFWCGASAIMLILATGFPPAFWTVEPINNVQFPWRLMLPIEFAVVTAFVLAAPRLRDPVTLAALGVLGLAGALVVLLVTPRLFASVQKSAGDIAIIRKTYADAPEYLPAGSPLPLGPDGVPDPSRVVLPLGPPVSAGLGTRVRAVERPDGGIAVTVESRWPTRVVAKRHAFPHWRLLDERGRRVTIAGSGRQTVAWHALPGRSTYRLQPGPAPGEVASAASSATTLALLALWSLGAFWRRRARQRRSASLESAR